MKDFFMGNQAIGLAAIAAGVRFVSGYPGTPSTEVLETIAKNNPGDIHVEWSDNEKAALEAAAGASYAGARSMVTMKQVGLNVATDPVMSLSYIGVEGGMILIVADDPGPISSQTEQDTRTFGLYSKIPVFDPSSPEEAYDMVEAAFSYSETYHTPVILRPVTRIDHGNAVINVKKRKKLKTVEGFVKDSQKWVIFPKLSNANHRKIFMERIPQMSRAFSDSVWNPINGKGKHGILTGGTSYEYVMEALNGYTGVRVLKIGTPYPWPEKKVLEFLNGLKDVLVVEELDPYLEDELYRTLGKSGKAIKVYGKRTGDIAPAGENSVESVSAAIKKVLGSEATGLPSFAGDMFTGERRPDLPVRPPVLCAGCSHRASFFAVKQAMKGKQSVFTGDIGCYTLGNAAPLDMVDTCLCMGAGITIAQGLYHIQPDRKYFAFIGDSTFFASGITGVINAVYNKADLTVCILDNSTTAMTGHQPHPGTGRTMMGTQSKPVDIKKVLKAIGVETVETADPMKHDKAVETVRRVSAINGVKAIIFRHPCVAIVKKPSKVCFVSQSKCTGCFLCINSIGCPAISKYEISDAGTGKSKAVIDKSLCTACGLCTYVCPAKAIGRKEL